MNAPFALAAETVRLARLEQADEAERIERHVTAHGGTVFHRPAWLCAVAAGTGQPAHGLLAERDGQITGWLPLNAIHSPIFGRMLASSGFAVAGGILAASPDGAFGGTAKALCTAAEELARRLSCDTIELRGGPAAPGWHRRTDNHCGFVAPLAADDAAQLTAIPRKQRAELRKGLAADLTVTTGTGARDRAAHYAVYAASVRNLGTPVFPRRLFDAVLDQMDADILTVWHGAAPVASVLSLYHQGAVMPYWGGGTQAARHLRANDRMYFELMRHGRQRGCDRFDFGRSKTGSGAYHFKRNWGFDPVPLSYSSWTMPGAEARDADPTSGRHAGRIALWKKLPLPVANAIGPIIARGLG